MTRYWRGTTIGVAAGVALAACCWNMAAAQTPGAPQPIANNGIEYVPPKNPEHQKIYEMVKERRALEALQQILSPFRLPLDVTIKTTGCDGVPNAWYERQGRQPIVSLCYEFLQEIMDKMPKETTAAGVSPADAVVGQFFYAALHEVGHATFDLYDVPVFGREEDAADSFAAYIMLQFGKDQARRLIGGAAFAYYAFRNQISSHIDQEMAKRVLDMTWLAQSDPRPKSP